MGKLFIPSDKESMRMAMLKHEETFKQQVYELHRLYQIQKALMESIENIRPNGASRLDESDIELTLGLPTNKNGISTPPRTSDSGPSFSSSSAESCHMTIECRNGGKIHLEEELQKERLRQAPWIFQVLTMNMT